MSSAFSYRSAFLIPIIVLVLILSTTAATFKNPELIDTSYDPRSVATGDWNGDGISDLVYIDGASPSTLHILIGNGDGTFLHKQDIGLTDGIGPTINVGDVTKDGIVDIILGGAVSTTGEIAVFAGNGDGTFQPPVVSTIVHQGGNGGTPNLNSVMGIGDVNGDGAADLVIGDPNSATLYVLLGNNSSKFSLGTTITFYFSGEADAYLYDLNGDGHLDVVVNNLVGAQTIVWLGKGNGTFQGGVSYTSYAVTLADLDGDGHPDLVGEIYPGQVQALLGNADGTFGSPTPLTTVRPGDFLLTTSDLNGDGIVDLIFLTPTGVGVVLGQGNLTYGGSHLSVAGTPSQAGYLQALKVGDFNGDGRQDFAMSVFGGVLILLGKGDGTFASADYYDIGHPVGAVTVADFSGDKIPDIAVSVEATYPRLLVGTGTGQFTLATDQNQSYGNQNAATSMIAADFNDDGSNDLYTLVSTQAYQFGQPLILFGGGNDLFSAPLAIASGAALVGDLNGDGHSDMVALGDSGIVAFLGQSNESFTQISTALIHTTYGVAALGDVNRDGKPDLLTFEYPSLRVWLGNGDGTFRQTTLLGTPPEQVNPMSATIADLDGDGNADVIVVSYPNQGSFPYPFLVYYGNGDGTFQDAVLLPLTHPYTQLVVADINGDNRADLVMSDGNCIAVAANLGGRSFGPEEHYVAGQMIAGLTVADLNKDGFPDIVAANAGGTTVTILLNEPNGNAGDGAPSDGVFTVSPNPSQYGVPVTLSITMSSPSGPVPSGSVSFNVDGSYIASVGLANGIATYSFNGVLETGTHTFVATYEGDKRYAPESFALLHHVTAPIYATTTVLGANPTTVYTSQTVRLQATVSSVVQVPSGAVTFMDGTNTLGSRTIGYYGSQTVIFDTNLLAAGTHTITAIYQGWQDPFGHQEVFEPSTSNPVIVVVNAIPTNTNLQASNVSPTEGTVVTFTADVTSSLGVPFGGVTFYDGTAVLGTSSLLEDGSCTFSIASLTVGTHQITAVYNANATFAGSTSSVVAVTVNPANIALAPTAVTLRVARDGDSALLQARVASANGNGSGDVRFLDNGTILGRAGTDASGAATLMTSLTGAGIHNLSASYSGSSQFAPSASPDLVEQTPNQSDDFSLSLSVDAVDLTSGDSATVILNVIPKAGSRQEIQLACAGQMASGYECSFSPDSLYGGESYLRIKRSGQRSRNSSPLFFGVGVGLLSLLLVGTTGVRRYPALELALLCGAVMLTAGCGVPQRSLDTPQLVVVSVRATAGTGPNAIVHSGQILMKIPK